jgi:hypothetical protein
MRKTIGGIAILVSIGCSGEARSAGWPSWLPIGWHRSCASGTCGAFDDSPLVPQLTHWTFQRSNCRLPICSGLDFHRDDPTGEVPYFPPLPYSHRAAGAAAPAGPGMQGAATFP